MVDSTFKRVEAFLNELDAAAAAELLKRDQEIGRLGTQISVLSEQKEALVAENARKDAVSAEKDRVIAERDAKIKALQLQIDELNAKITQLEQGSAKPTEGLFFDLPARKDGNTFVFAHYFPVFPLTIDNQNPSTDYYARNWLVANGEGGVHASYGGRLRDRPLTSAPYSGDWRKEAATEELRAAIKYGIDGFFVNLMSTAHANTFNALKDAANSSAEFKNFKVIPMVDTNGSLDNTQSAVVSVVSSFIQTQNALQLEGGAYAVASFKAEGRDAAWWDQLAKDVQAQTGKRVEFIHVYNSGNIGTLPQHAAGIWGPGTDPVTVNAWAGTKARADQLGVKSLYPVWPSDVRVKSGNADEPRGFGGLRASFDKSVAAKPDFIQLCTWDDLTEASQFKPTAMRGTAILEYTAYRIAELRTGSKPKILKDAVFVAHRNQTLNARVTGGQTVMMRQWRSPIAGRGSTVTDGFKDTIEVVTFLTQTRTVNVTVGDKKYSYVAPAGEFSNHLPASAGTVAVSVEGSVSFTSPIAIRDVVVNQDRAYAYSSSLGNASKQYDPTPR